VTVCAVATRCLAYSAMPPYDGRRGSRTPKARKPTRFRDGVPHQWQSFRSGPGRRRTCNPPLKRRQLCQLSYGARAALGRGRHSVTGRDRTCDAPRFKRALYRAELRSRDWRSRSRTGDLLRIREALCRLSYPPARSDCCWDRTQLREPPGSLRLLPLVRSLRSRTIGCANGRGWARTSSLLCVRQALSR
jgi:hypothetical protein